MSLEKYNIPAETSQRLYEIKKSRFIARVSHVSDRQMAMDFVHKARLDYPDARHYCWAYIIGSPLCPKTVASNDDGEPSGTAGKPILNVLQHKDIGDLIVVVIRYFGGIKLGAAGLVRAYSRSAQGVIETLKVNEYVPKLTVKISCDFREEQSVRHRLTALHAKILYVEYTTGVVMQVAIGKQEVETLVSDTAHMMSIDVKQ